MKQQLLIKILAIDFYCIFLALQQQCILFELIAILGFVLINTICSTTHKVCIYIHVGGYLLPALVKESVMK